MKRILGCLVFLGVIATGVALCADKTEKKDAPIVPKEKVELFNGKDLTGWVSYLKGGVEASKVWSVENGVIKCVGKPNGFLRTEKTYADYKVTVEWKFVKAGNTGVLVHMTSDEKVWPDCVECQGMHAHQGDMYFWSGAKAKEAKPLGKGSGFTIQRTAPDAEKAVGEWNTYEVVCEKNTVTILVNGKEVNKATECSSASGHIGIQSEGAQLEIRKVTLEPLSK